MNQEFTVSELAAEIGGEIVGDASIKISEIADLSFAKPGEIAFVEDEKLFATAANSKAGCLIVPTNHEIAFGGVLIRVKQPKLAFAQIAARLYPAKKLAGEIHQTAIVHESAKIGVNVFVGAFASVGENSVVGDNTRIHHGAQIGDNVSINANCVIHPNAVLYDNVSIGDSVILHAGVVIGADGFGYVRAPNGYIKFPQIGTVVIEAEVEIGANTCIDRAALGETRIGRGAKIDNLVQIAHNVQIGERVVIASQTGISGSTIIESDAVIGGQVGMGDHARVQSGAIIGSKAGVLPGKIVRAGVWWGIPVQPLDEYKRQNAHVKALPRLREEVKNLRERLVALENILANENERNEK